MQRLMKTTSAAIAKCNLATAAHRVTEQARRQAAWQADVIIENDGDNLTEETRKQVARAPRHSLGGALEYTAFFTTEYTEGIEKKIAICWARQQIGQGLRLHRSCPLE